MIQIKSSRRRLVVGCCAAAAVAAGCAPSGFTITPVSTRRELVETELSRDGWPAWGKIALIDVSGTLANEPGGRLLGSGEHPVSLLTEQLDKAREDGSVKAVILRINSPGGTVVASELMHDEITHFKTSGKPVIAVMMDVAASGAYYIACACDQIVAQPSSVTGSIGVIMQMFDVSGTLKLIGARSDAIISGAFKDAGSPFREMSERERELFQGIVDEMYGRFVDVVVAGRPGLDERRVRELADGRVFTAGQALEFGLIDRIATVREAIELTKDSAGLKNARLVTYHRPEGYRPNYYAAGLPSGSPTVSLISVDLARWMHGAAPRFFYLWAPGMTAAE